MALRRPARLPLPEGLPPRAVRLASTAARCRTIVDLALDDDGGAVTAWEADRRRRPWRPLEQAARRAMVAACSSSPCSASLEPP